MPSFREGEFFSISSLEKYQLELEWSGSSRFPLIGLVPAAASAICASPPCMMAPDDADEVSPFPSSHLFCSALLCSLLLTLLASNLKALLNPREDHKQVQEEQGTRTLHRRTRPHHLQNPRQTYTHSNFSHTASSKSQPPAAKPPPLLKSQNRNGEFTVHQLPSFQASNPRETKPQPYRSEDALKPQSKETKPRKKKKSKAKRQAANRNIYNGRTNPAVQSQHSSFPRPQKPCPRDTTLAAQ